MSAKYTPWDSEKMLDRNPVSMFLKEDKVTGMKRKKCIKTLRSKKVSVLSRRKEEGRAGHQ